MATRVPLHERLIKEVGACQRELLELEDRRKMLVGRLEGLKFALAGYPDDPGPGDLRASAVADAPPPREFGARRDVLPAPDERILLCAQILREMAAEDRPMRASEILDEFERRTGHRPGRHILPTDFKAHPRIFIQKSKGFWFAGSSVAPERADRRVDQRGREEVRQGTDSSSTGPGSDGGGPEGDPAAEMHA